MQVSRSGNAAAPASGSSAREPQGQAGPKQRRGSHQTAGGRQSRPDHNGTTRGGSAVSYRFAVPFYMFIFTSICGETETRGFLRGVAAVFSAPMEE